LELDAKECGYCIAPKAQLLTAVLHRLMEMRPEERRRMGENGRAWMERDFSWKEIARHMIDFYCSIVGNEAAAAIPVDAAV
jgi:glycosyltransferase involved in cell wall biosynthesis